MFLLHVISSSKTTKKEHKKLPPLWDESCSHVLPPKFPMFFAKHRLCRSFDRPLTLDHASALRQQLLNHCLHARRGSSGTIFHPPPRPVLSSSGSLHWGCVCTYPFTGKSYRKNILKCGPLCQVDSILKSILVCFQATRILQATSLL